MNYYTLSSQSSNSNIGFDSRYNLYHHRIVFFCHSSFYTRSQSYLFLRLHLFINSPIRIRYSRTQLNAFIYSAVCTCERAESWTARARVNGGGSVFTSHVMSTPPRHNLRIIYGVVLQLEKRIFQEHENRNQGHDCVSLWYFFRSKQINVTSTLHDENVIV